MRIKIKSNRKMFCVIVALTLLQFVWIAEVEADKASKFQPVDPNRIPEILTMISDLTKSNYEQIKTWQGEVDVIKDYIYEETKAEKVFNEDTDGKGEVPSKIREHRESIIKFSLDAEKEFLYSNYYSYSAKPLQYIDMENGRDLGAKGILGRRIAILTPEYQLDCTGDRMHNGVVMSRSAVKKTRPKNSSKCDSNMHPVYDPRASFTNFTNTWKLFPALVEYIEEHGEYKVDEYYLKVEERKSGDITEYRIMLPSRAGNPDSYQYVFSTMVFSSNEGFNIISYQHSTNNITLQSRTWDYDLVNDIYVPIETTQKDFNWSNGTLSYECIITFKNQKVNEPISEDVFTYKNLGLQNGDKFIDKTTDKEFEYQAGELIEISEKSLKNSGENISKWGHSQNQTSISESKKNVQISQNSNDVLEVVTTEPNSPAVLKVGEKMNVTIFYELKSLEKAAIWTRPYLNGNLARNYSAHHLTFVSNEPNDTGFVTGWFYFDKPAQIDEVRVFMRDLATNNTVKTISHKVSAQWIESKGQ